MPKSKFNLQLFADEDTVSLDTLKEQGFSDEDLQSVIPKEAEVTPEPIFETTPEPESEPEPTPKPEPEPTEPEPEPTAPDSDKVSKHVPYDRFKEVNDKNKALAAEIAALKAQQQPTQQPTPQQPPQQRQNVDELISKQADEIARGKLKITEDIDTLQYTDPAKYRNYVKEVAKAEIRLENSYQERQQTYQQNVNFVQEIKQMPNFQTAYNFAVQELDELPGKIAKPIYIAIDKIDNGIATQAEINLAREHLKKCNEKLNSINTQAPVGGAISLPTTTTTTPLDKAAGLPKAQNLSGSKTSAMSWAQVEDLIRQGKVEQIPKDMIKQIDPRLLE